MNNFNNVGTLEKLAKELKELGYEVYGYKPEGYWENDYSSIYVGRKGNKIVGYVSRDYEGFYTIGRAYKPNIESGSGVVIMDGLVDSQVVADRVLNAIEFKVSEEWKDIREWYAYEKKFGLFKKV